MRCPATATVKTATVKQPRRETENCQAKKKKKKKRAEEKIKKKKKTKKKKKKKIMCS